MKKKELLEILKRDDGFALSDWLTEEQGDFNLTIRNKPLIELAFALKAGHCANILLLHGAWSENLKDLTKDESFTQMIQEIEEDIVHNRRRSRGTLSLILDELSRMILGPHPFSHRDILSYEEQGRKDLMCGIHLFEYVNWDFLTKHIKNAFKCSLIPEGKYALVLSAVSKLYMEDLPPLSERITGFLRLQEVPLEGLEKILDTMKTNAEEILIGVHYAEIPILRTDRESLDVPPIFFDSMKLAIDQALNPPKVRFHDQIHRIRNIASWDDELHEAVVQFKLKHGVYPHILLASTTTYHRIDMVANDRHQERIKNSEGNSAEKFVSMSGFRGDGYELDFCIEEKLPVDSVKLIVDSHPGGGEPLPEELEEIPQKSKAG